MRLPRLSRAASCCLFLTVALAGSEARAQFANHSIGVELGGIYIANPAAQNFGSGGGLGIDATLYIESGFDLYFRVLVSLHRTDQEPQTNVFALMPEVGFRYLFSEDTIRPYLGLGLAYLAVFDSDYQSRINLVPTAGIEFFVADNCSLGIQLEYHLILQLPQLPDPEHALVGAFKVAWYF